jgi:hypothetical protein
VGKNGIMSSHISEANQFCSFTRRGTHRASQATRKQRNFPYLGAMPRGRLLHLAANLGYLANQSRLDYIGLFEGPGYTACCMHGTNQENFDMSINGWKRWGLLWTLQENHVSANRGASEPLDSTRSSACQIFLFLKLDAIHILLHYTCPPSPPRELNASDIWK